LDALPTYKEIAGLKQAVADRDALLVAYSGYLDRDPLVLQYRRAYFEARGHVAPGGAVPTARAWPRSGEGLTYEQRLIALLPKDGIGAEIGPLNLPMLGKEEYRVLYVDHLDAAGLRAKYVGLEGIVEIDRPMVSHSLAETLRGDTPLAYIVASQVLEHVPDPIGWLTDAASALDVGGLFALSLPDRRYTFDFFRTETRTADWIALHMNGVTVPDARAVYDNQMLATAVNVPWMRGDSITPDEITASRGAVTAEKVEPNHMQHVRRAQAGEYLDQHVSVFTPPNFLMVMAQLASDGLLPYRCHQFYPSGWSGHPDRGLSSFTVVLEKIDGRTSPADARRSFLECLGDH
jgi:hypothetical protein